MDQRASGPRDPLLNGGFGHRHASAAGVWLRLLYRPGMARLPSASLGPRPPADRLERVRSFRVRPERDETLGFLVSAFQRDVARPHKQLAALTGVWAELVPAGLADRTALLALSRGTLTVAVDSSATLDALDRLLRGGLRVAVIKAHTGPAIRRIKLQVDSGM